MRSYAVPSMVAMIGIEHVGHLSIRTFSVVIVVSCWCTNALPVTFASNVFDGEVTDDFTIAFHDPSPIDPRQFVRARETRANVCAFDQFVDTRPPRRVEVGAKCPIVLDLRFVNVHVAHLSDVC